MWSLADVPQGLPKSYTLRTPGSYSSLSKMQRIINTTLPGQRVLVPFSNSWYWIPLYRLTPMKMDLGLKMSRLSVVSGRVRSRPHRATLAKRGSASSLSSSLPHASKFNRDLSASLSETAKKMTVWEWLLPTLKSTTIYLQIPVQGSR